MKVNLLAHIEEIQIEVVPGWKDFSYGSEIISSRQRLPTLFLMGKRWKIRHPCNCCNQIIEVSRHMDGLVVNEENFFQAGYLIETRMPNDIMDNPASAFGNLKEKKENDRRFYVLRGDNNEIGEVLANVFYYKCHNCMAKYLATYCFKFGEDGDGGGKVEPNYVYIEEIASVDFSESDAKSILSV